MNHSPIVFDDIRLARRTDPRSSHEAARKSAKFRQTHAGRILEALDECEWCTDEIADRAGLTVVQVCRRLPEMAEQGLVERVQHDGHDLILSGFTVWRAKRA